MNVLRNIRNAFLMGLTWVMVWAPVGPLIGLIVDPDGSMDEPWILIGAYPGFICGVMFFAMLRIAERRRVDELSLARVAAWGAATGLLLPALFALFIVAGGGNLNAPVTGTWVSVFAGIMTLLGAVAASVWLAVAKRWKNHPDAAEAL